MRTISLTVLSYLLLVNSYAAAQTSTSPSVSVRPFLMGGEIRGDLVTQGISSDFSQGFGNGFEKGNGAVGLDIDVHGDTWGSVSQIWFTALSDTSPSVGLSNSVEGAEQRLNATFFTQAVGLSLFRQDRSFIDLTLGGRLAHVENRLTTRSAGREIDQKQARTWIDPLVGINTALYGSESVLFRIGGDVGGFSAASELTWQAWASVGVRISDRAGAHVGYRTLNHRFKSSEFGYDIAMRGPTLGFDFGF